MRSTSIVSALLICLSPLARAADTYNIDAAHSNVGFAVSHLVINTVKGKFNELTGSVVLDGTQITEAKGTIQTKSIDTGVAARDKHLRSADFFDVEKYPTINFQAKRVETKGADPVLVGDFTMHGVTKEISMPVTVKGPIKDPWGNTRVGLQAKTKLNRKDYGLTWSKTTEAGGLIVGDEVEIEINAEASKAAAK
ncbi:MAG TPA: YceI family protein [Candidatus Binatia bacterium]|jgi:polyisoprenoid-binding protein YceI|nr:YceI family protein [Candidatus Binatia bacterium]